MAKHSLSRQVSTSLSRRILALVYPPGHRLTEAGLCAEFGVSRSPVREALGVLVAGGLVEKRDRQGYSVRPLDHEAMGELYDTYLVLEVALVERACVNGIPAAALERQERYWREVLEQLPTVPADVADRDAELHEILASASGNRTLGSLLHDTRERIAFARLADLGDPGRVESTCRDHIALLRAVGGRDAVCGADAVRRNVEWSRRNADAVFRHALAAAGSHR